MRLIYIANARLPTEKAHGIQIMKMCQAFSLAGVEVELIVPWRFNKIKKDPFDYYGIKKNFKIKTLPSIDLIPLGLSKIGFWIQSITFATSVFFYLIFKKVDIIYSRDLFSLWFLSFFRKNLVYEAHTFPRHLFLYGRVFKKTKMIIVITQKLKELFIQQGVISDKILVAPDGVDLKDFNIKESQEKCRRKLNLSRTTFGEKVARNLPLDKKIVLYTGHLYEWKGVQTLAKAAKFLEENVLIIFVGGTEEDISKFKTQNSKLKNILIAGHWPHSEIPYWLKAADVLVLPNSGKEEISKKWTSPIKMFEYMASKRPIIASDLPSIKEILNENNAILVEPDNSKELAEGIKKVLRNSQLSAKISNQAFGDAQEYTWQKRAENILEFTS